MSLGDQTLTITPDSPAEAFDPAKVKRPVVDASAEDGGEMVTVPLIDVAWARSGDKGGDANLGVWARTDEAAEWLLGALTLDAARSLLVFWPRLLAVVAGFALSTFTGEGGRFQSFPEIDRAAVEIGTGLDWGAAH